MSNIQKDMERLAKLVHKLSKKHGDIYISATHVKDRKLSRVMYGERLTDAMYWEDREDENI